MAQGSSLIASNLDAAELYSALKQALSQLDLLKTDECPSKLVDMTLARLKLAINRTQTAAHDLQLQ